MTDVVDLIHRDPGGHGGGKGVDQGHRGIGDIQRIAVRRLEHRHRDDRVAIAVDRRRCVVVESVLHITHIAQPQQAPFRRAPHDQIAEVVETGEVAVVLDQHRIGVELIA